MADLLNCNSLSPSAVLCASLAQLAVVDDIIAGERFRPRQYADLATGAILLRCDHADVIVDRDGTVR